MMVKPFIGKARIKEVNNHYIIEIPSPRNWFLVAFLSVWLCGWLMGWIFAFSTIMSSLFTESSGVEFFLLFWLIGWTIGGGFTIKTLVWMILGVEIISIHNNQLQIERKGDWLAKTKIYDLISAHQFRITTNSLLNNFPFHGNYFWGSPEKMGKIQFDYGMQTIQFGIGIDEAEGRFLLEQMRSKNLINR